MSNKENLTKADGIPKVNAKVEGIEVKRPQFGVAAQSTAMKGPKTPSMSAAIPTPPKLSPTTGRMNMNMEKAQPTNATASPKKAAPAENTWDYSQWQRPQYANDGKVKPLNNPDRMKKADDPYTADYSRMLKCVRAFRKSCAKSLDKADAAGKNPMPVYMRE